jgi:NDP-sugar pyrophosphorylase family protein
MDNSQSRLKLPPIVILAGGLGTRLGQLTQATPKSMVLVNGEPFVAHQLRLLARKRVEEVVFCLGHQAQQIEEFVGSGEQFDLKVTYSFDGDELLGTGGAVRKAMSLAGTEFGVLYGDSYLDIDIVPIFECFKKSAMPGLMTVLPNDNQIQPSNVWMEKGRIKAYGKENRLKTMRHIDYGLSFFLDAAFDGFQDKSRFDLGEVVSSLISSNNLAAYEVRERFYEIGSMPGILELEMYLNSRAEELS